MRLLISLIALITGCFAAQIPFFANGVAESTRYDNYKLIRVEKLLSKDLDLMETIGIDVWGKKLDYVEILVSPEQLNIITTSFPHIEFKIINDNIQEAIEQETQRLASSSQNIVESNWHQEFHPYDNIKKWYKGLASTYSDKLYIEFIPSVGQSYEGRDLFAFRFSSREGDLTRKKQIYFQSQIHAREWISAATLQYVVDSLISGYGSDEHVTSLLDSIEFIIIPVVNPDGYEYTWTYDRMWRKNRRDNGGFSYGVDLNRNWNVDWDSNTGSSRSPYSEVYKGRSPFSEPETKALSDYFLQHPRIVAAIDFHSYSQLILRPPGLENSPVSHPKQLKAVGDKMSEIIKGVHGKTYRSIASVDLYPTSGSASEWFAQEEVAKEFGHHVYGYTFELRPDNSFNGFIIPPSEIIPTGEEILAAMKYFCKAVIENPLD